MPKFTTPKELWDRIDALQSVGGSQYEGNYYNSPTLRYVKADQGIDVECNNRYYGDGVTPEGLEQLDPTPLPIKQQTGDVVEDRDKRIELGTITESDRGFWEDINFDESTLQPYLTSNLRKTVETRLVSVADEIGAIVYKEIPPGFSDREYSIDALPFVTDPNNDNEIIRVDKYYDKEINLNEYSLATEGKINYYLYPREDGRFLPNFPIDTYKHKGRKIAPGTEHPSNWFDRTAEIKDDDGPIVNKNKGYFVFDLDWGDGTPKEHNRKPKLLESSVMLDHHYEKPGFYTITGTVFKSNGYKIDQYERFKTNILLNPSKNYDFDLFRHRNFATIGGISTSSTLVKSVSSMIGLDPFDFHDDRVEDNILDEYNELDKIDLLNLMNMIKADSVEKYKEKYIDPYSAVIDDEPSPVMGYQVIHGCLDPNADNFVDWANVNRGCQYSFKLEASINGMGGQTPIIFIGQIARDGVVGLKDRYFLNGAAYEDWNNVVNEISSNDIMGGDLIPATLTGTLIQSSTDTSEWSIQACSDNSLIEQITPMMTITLRSTDDEPLGDFVITENPQGNNIKLAPSVPNQVPLMLANFSIQDSSFQTNNPEKFALVISPSTIYPELASSEEVPFDGWTMPDGVLVGKINTSDSGTPIIEQVLGSDLPSEVAGQGFGYEIDVPVSAFNNPGIDQRVYILKIDPDNPPSATNYEDRMIIANWSGDTEDTGMFDPAEQLFYVPINLSVIEGDGGLVLTTSPPTGQDGFIVGDNVFVMFTPEANVKLLTFTYNGVQILPTDSRIGNEVGGPPLLDVYNEFGEDVNYTFNFIVEDVNNIEATFEEQEFGEETEQLEYETIEDTKVRIHPVWIDSFNNQGLGTTGVRFTTSTNTNPNGFPSDYFTMEDIGTLLYGPYGGNEGYIEQEFSLGSFVNVSATGYSLEEGGNTFLGWYSKSPFSDDYDRTEHLISLNPIAPQFVSGNTELPHYYEEEGVGYHELWAVVESGF